MTDQTVYDHVHGLEYGGKIVSTLPAPEGWLVCTEVRQTKRGEDPTTEGETWHPLIAWGHVETMDRTGDPVSRLEPLFLEDFGAVVHASEFRWLHSAGHTDDGWRTSVTVDVVPPKEMRQRLDSMNRRFCTRHTDRERTAYDCEKCQEERR
ncbi:hypothetical protein [Streptomyces sp. NPDC058045]|uniref:hypothetical protein n=1 Tax=Streptomyces sp. NPDC058045 TaxID=3346311 RepID=UPI0036ECC04E